MTMTDSELKKLAVLVDAKNAGLSVQDIARKSGVSPGMLSTFFGVCSAVGVRVARKPLSEASKATLRANAAKARASQSKEKIRENTAKAVAARWAKARAARKPAVSVRVPAQEVEDFRRWKAFLASMETRQSTAA